MTALRIYVTKNFCDCRLCRGSHKITTDLDREAFVASRAGYSTKLVGARNPRLITFPDHLLVGLESANGHIIIDDPSQSRWDIGLDRCGPEVFYSPDSVHGCSKIRENQGFHLYLRAEFYNSTVEVVDTRPHIGITIDRQTRFTN